MNTDWFLMLWLWIFLTAESAKGAEGLGVCVARPFGNRELR